MGIRFIPACAGNAGRRGIIARGPPVHPRVCGERRSGGRRRSRSPGSSPRVRGTPQSGNCTPTGWRFIPACAGNAHSGARTAPVLAVHPRVCGERAGLPRPGARDRGSSPRVRGTLSTLTVPSNGNRFIPACAGNAFVLTRFTPFPAVHPRVCGERCRHQNFRPQPVGSSPRVRGTLRDFPQLGCVIRFIPACAGNASASALQTSKAPVHPRVCGERTSSNPLNQNRKKRAKKSTR